MKTPSYGMYTHFGDNQIHALVNLARSKGSTWPQVYAALEYLSTAHPEQVGEATDTAVREAVYDALGFTSPFYI
jgi:hypothetical protein